MTTDAASAPRVRTDSSTQAYPTVDGLSVELADGVLSITMNRPDSLNALTMAMLAAPQPSFSCLIKGTSSQMPGVAAKTKPQRHRMQMSLCGIFRAIKIFLADSHDNQHQHRDAENNQE